MWRALFAVSILAAAPVLRAQEPPDVDYSARMEREHADDEPIAGPATAVDPETEIVSQESVYARLEGSEIAGYVAHPAAGVPKEGIVVIHEWWGLNDNIKAMTRRLAGEGYIALAVDLYAGQVAEDRQTAARLARASGERHGQLVDNLRQAIAELRRAGAERLGVIGWCFGGGWSLRTALAFPEEIGAAVIYYGRLTSDPKELEALEAPLLGIFGALDEGIPVSAVREFQASLDALGKTAVIHVYEGADHAFANPSGTRYNESAAGDAWAKTLAFFADHLR